MSLLYRERPYLCLSSIYRERPYLCLSYIERDHFPATACMLPPSACIPQLRDCLPSWKPPALPLALATMQAGRKVALYTENQNALSRVLSTCILYFMRMSIQKTQSRYTKYCGCKKMRYYILYFQPFSVFLLCENHAFSYYI